jgi:hypothetical protein
VYIYIYGPSQPWLITAALKVIPVCIWFLIVLAHHFTLKMETSCFSRTLAFMNQSTQQFNPKELHHNCDSCENLKSNSSTLSSDEKGEENCVVTLNI